MKKIRKIEDLIDELLKEVTHGPKPSKQEGEDSFKTRIYSVRKYTAHLETIKKKFIYMLVIKKMFCINFLPN